LTTWHCILSAELTKAHSFRLLFWWFCQLGQNLVMQYKHVGTYLERAVFFFTNYC